MSRADRIMGRSNIDIESSTETRFKYPTRLEHSYYNDNVYWSLAPININNVDNIISNTTILPRISWKVTDTSTALTDPAHEGTHVRKWVFPTTTSTTTIGTFPFEPLTHGYDTNQEGDSKNTTNLKIYIIKNKYNLPIS